MRILLKAYFPVEAANAAVTQNTLSQTIQSILSDLQPEAAYFLDDHGKRTAYVFLDIQDASRIPAVAEPWFLALNAGVELHPVMNAEDLKKAQPHIEAAAKRYGKAATAAAGTK